MEFGRYAKDLLMKMVDKLHDDKKVQFKERDNQMDYMQLIGNYKKNRMDKLSKLDGSGGEQKWLASYRKPISEDYQYFQLTIFLVLFRFGRSW